MLIIVAEVFLLFVNLSIEIIREDLVFQFCCYAGIKCWKKYISIDHTTNTMIIVANFGFGLYWECHEILRS